MEHKKEFIKHAEGLSDTKKIDILDLPALNIPSGYKLDMNQGILKFNETTLMFEQICPQIVIIEARYINIDSGEEKNKVTFVDRFKTKSLIVDAETVSNSRSIKNQEKQFLDLYHNEMQVKTDLIAESVLFSLQGNIPMLPLWC